MSQRGLDVTLSASEMPIKRFVSMADLALDGGLATIAEVVEI
jgi:hypothetical protein